ncbi:MAG: hypothetical protein QNJ63_05670 [Calothrix sp. MO_192.B10]|nr:hypothetical protein [Calothrix sp. MO_192.B10]
MFNYPSLLLSLTLIPSIILVSSINLSPVSSQMITQQSTGWSSIFRRPPKKPLGSRGETCISKIYSIAPGIIDTYIVWSDRPLFLWQYSGDNKQVELIVRELGSDKDVWTQTVNLKDKKAFYGGKESLKPGTIYEWQLSGSTEGALFKIMPKDERDKVQKQLQALEQQLKNAKASPEEIALRKAAFFLNYEIIHKTENNTFNAWSDALLALYQVNKPSPAFVKNREQFLKFLCTSASSNTSSK